MSRSVAPAQRMGAACICSAGISTLTYGLVVLQYCAPGPLYVEGLLQVPSVHK